MCALQISYFSVFLMAAMIGNNLFINCCLVGIGETLGGILSGIALSKMSDKNAF